MPQYHTGHRRSGSPAELKSIHKLVRVNADDSKALVVKNLGNGRRVPLLWATEVTMASGTTEIVVASGVSFSAFDVSGAKTFVTAAYTVVSGVTYQTDLVGTVYMEKNTTDNTLTLKTTTASGISDQDTIFDVLIFLGDNATYTSSSSNMLWRSSGTNRAG